MAFSMFNFEIGKYNKCLPEKKKGRSIVRDSFYKSSQIDYQSSIITKQSQGSPFEAYNTYGSFSCSRTKLDEKNKSNKSEIIYKKEPSFISEINDNEIDENPHEKNEVKFQGIHENDLQVKAQLSQIEKNRLEEFNQLNTKLNDHLNYFESFKTELYVRIRNLETNILGRENSGGSKKNDKIFDLGNDLEKNSEIENIESPGFIKKNPISLTENTSFSKTNKESFEKHQHTPSFNPNNESLFFIRKSIVEEKKKPLLINTETELVKIDSTNSNNDYSPILDDDNKNIPTFHEKYLVEKIAMENPCSDDYITKKSFFQAKESHSELMFRVSCTGKSFDDFDLTYSKDNLVPNFNFNSNKSYHSNKENMVNSALIKKENKDASEYDNNDDQVELGTNETKSVNEMDDNFEKMKHQNEIDNLKFNEIKEADPNEEGEDEIVYFVDDDGYLKDENENFVFSPNNQQIKFSPEQIQYLKQSNNVEIL